MSRILFLIFLPYSFWHLVNCENQTCEMVCNDGYAESSSKQYSFFRSKKWFSQAFMEAELIFHIDKGASKLCQQDFYTLRQHLNTNQSSWAVRMFESSEWPRVGLLSGKKYHLGNWAECLDADTKNFKGQYCLVEAKFDFLNVENPGVISKESLAWSDLQKYHEDPNQLVNLQNIYWAMCIPSSCQPSDLELSMRNTVLRVFNNNSDVVVDVKVDPKMCSVRSDKKLPLSFYLTGSFLVIWVFFVLYATYWNERENKRAGLHWLSVSHNFKQLTEYSSDVYPVFYFVNGINSLIVMFGHRVYFYLGFPQFSAAGIDKLPVHFSQLIFGNLLNFNFTISGYLLCHMYMKKFSTADASQVVLFLIFRWLRKISVLLVILPIVMYISPYPSNGPLYDYFMSPQIDACKCNWWAVLFAVNNFETSSKTCLLHTWFTSTELQLTLLGTIILFIKRKHKKLGLLVAMSFFILATILLFQTSLRNEFPALFAIPISQVNFMFTHGNWTHMRLYSRLGPFFVGFFTASIVQELRDRGFKFSYQKKMIMMVVSLTIALKTYNYGCSLHTSDVIENALYAAFYRSILMLPFASFLCIFFTSGFGAFEKFFENKIFITYGRLLNFIYIIGPILQFSQIISQETFVTPSMLMLFWLAAGDFIIILVLAVIGYLFFEAPMLNILKIWQKQVAK